MPNCRTCTAPIFFAVNVKTGKREPIDVEPVANGNIEVVSRERRPDGEIRVRHLLKGEGDSPTLFEPPPRYVSHYATCPDAQAWRDRQAAKT